MLFTLTDFTDQVLHNCSQVKIKETRKNTRLCACFPFKNQVMSESHNLLYNFLTLSLMDQMVLVCGCCDGNL